MTPPPTTSVPTARAANEPGSDEPTPVVGAGTDQIVAHPDEFSLPEAAAAPASGAKPSATAAADAASGGAARDGGRGQFDRLLDPPRRAWRVLTSMRTALILLFLLAVAAIPGSLFPQRTINPLKVQEYYAAHPTWAPILNRLGGFHVFGAPWFAAIYLLLFISLIGCLWSRVRWHLRALVGRPPAAPSRPGRLAGGSSWASTLAPDEAVVAAGKVLRSRRFRVAVAPPGATRAGGDPDHSVAAEKGYLRETGNLIFHIALVVVLLGVGLGSWFGYQGTVLVIQGNGYSNTLISYDQFSAGTLVDTAKLRPFSLDLDDFKATYEANGQPKDFVATVAYAEDLDAPTKHAEIRVNHPLSIGGSKIYLLGHGYAPHFVLRDKSGKTVWESYVPCTPRDGMFTSTCTVKIPDTGLPPVGPLRSPQQLAFTGFFTPTTIVDPVQGPVSVYPAAVAPGLFLTGWLGNLHVNEGIPQNIYSLDTQDLKQFGTDGPSGKALPAQRLALNDPKNRTMTGLPGGMSLEVDGLREFATFETKSDPYKNLVLYAAIAIIVGLVTSLRVRRRRVWVRARPAAGTGSTVEIGGLSRSDAEGFAAELTALTARVRAATEPPGPPPVATPSPPAQSPPAQSPAATATTEDATEASGQAEPSAEPDDQNNPSSTRREP
ncbi:cytochrome c biogenesis protein ResB [Pseudofrankia sp. BMG5.37]|uniref:cytochrome c biogenesis protein ResB n=1 Tax=Pseudofrankia sp. BMG5.37 TaxID=3050035 RepID=UPI002893C399|nr:cytochrome c biogenesis protein ResB [Pseudofrankia sp. BMG5.37]MDT3438625.1 cytochrome c biogenesis protein ResB [Pseudofrankia sp. BMG5.37]